MRPVRIAFLTTGATASASEINVNTMAPWVEIAIVGEDTFGKPVGQLAFDLQGCEDRLRLVAFKLENARGDGDYYDGLAGDAAVRVRGSGHARGAAGLGLGRTYRRGTRVARHGRLRERHPGNHRTRQTDGHRGDRALPAAEAAVTRAALAARRGLSVTTRGP